MSKNILAVFVGGAAGTLLRYWINLGTLTSTFPMGTLIENLLGSFLLGIFTGLFVYLHPRDWVKAGLGVGLCGGFTTMSTFGGDAFLLIVFSPMYTALSYIAISSVGGILFAFIGITIGKRVASVMAKGKKVVHSE